MPLRRSRDHWVPGRDPHAVRHAPPAPSDEARLDRTPTAVVVGGGIAGLAAATGLAERGVGGDAGRGGADAGRAGPRVAGGGRRHVDDDEPRVPCVLPAVLQPALAAATQRPDHGPAAAGGRLPAGPGRRAYRLLRRARRPGRRSTSWPSSRAAPASPSATSPASTSTRPSGCSTSRSRGPTTTTPGASAAEVLDELRFPDGARHLALEVFAAVVLRGPARLLRRRAGRDVPHLLPGVGRGAALRRALRRLRHGAVGAARPLPGRARACGWSCRWPRRRWRTAGVRVAVRLEDGSAVEADAVVLATDQTPLQRLVADVAAGWATRRGGCGSRPVGRRRRSRCGGCGSTGRCARGRRRSSRRAGSARSTTSRRCTSSRRERGGGRGAGTAASSRCTRTRCPTAPTRPHSGSSCATGCADLHPELDPANVVHEEWLVRADCPLVGTEPWRERPEVEHAGPADHAGRRRDPLRLPGRPDGARRDDRLDGGEPPPVPVGPARPRPLDGADDGTSPGGPRPAQGPRPPPAETGQVP